MSNSDSQIPPSPVLLKKTLNKWQLLSIGIGDVIGAGIFVLVGEAAGSYAGAAVVISFLLTAIACSCMALCYAELSSIYPTSGSSYSYASHILGRFMGTLIGILLILEYGIAGSTVAVGWSEYFVNFLADFNIHISPLWTHATGYPVMLADNVTATSIFNLPAFLGMIGVMLVLCRSVHETAFITSMMVILKVAVMILFIIIGIFYIIPDNYVPFVPEYNPETHQYGLWGIVGASGTVFFAYMGFNAVSTASSEAQNPQTDVPFAILGTLLICTVLYSLLAFVLTGVVNYKDLIGNNAPLALAADMIGIPWFKIVLKIGALIALTSVMLVSVYSMVRIMIFMAQDGLMPKIFTHISQTTQTPIYNTVIIGVILALLAGLLPIDILGDVVTSGALFCSAFVCFAVFWLDKTQPNLHRPFKVPLKPFVPLFGIVVCVLLAISLGIKTLIYLGFYILLMGILILIYRIKNKTVSVQTP